jgi:hypothetical protein
MPNISHTYDTNFISQFCDHICTISICNKPGGDDDDFAGDGFYAQVCDTVSRFLVESLASLLRVRNLSAFELQKIGQKFEMLVASGKTNGNNDCLMLDWVFENQETHH